MLNRLLVVLTFITFGCAPLIASLFTEAPGNILVGLCLWFYVVFIYVLPIMAVFLITQWVIKG
jgi:hypothetical protein